MNLAESDEICFFRDILIFSISQESGLSLQDVVQLKMEDVEVREDQLVLEDCVFQDPLIREYLPLRNRLFPSSPWLFPNKAGNHSNANKHPYRIARYFESGSCLHPKKLNKKQFDEMVRKVRFQYQRQQFQQVLALALMMGCALRPIEVANLHKSDFLFKQECFWLHNTKARENQPMPIPQNLQLPLSRYLSYLKSGEPLFVKKNGKPWERRDVTRNIQRFVERLEIDDINSRRIRNTVGAMLRYLGATLEEVRVFLRHKDIRTTIRHYAPDRLDHRQGIMDRYNPLCSLLDTREPFVNWQPEKANYTEQVGAGVVINC
jgi:integrase